MKLNNIKSNLKKVDAHKIKKSEYDELPDLTDDMFNRAVYKVCGVSKPAPHKRGEQKTSAKD